MLIRAVSRHSNPRALLHIHSTGPALSQETNGSTRSPASGGKRPFLFPAKHPSCGSAQSRVILDRRPDPARNSSLPSISPHRWPLAGPIALDACIADQPYRSSPVWLFAVCSASSPPPNICIPMDLLSSHHPPLVPTHGSLIYARPLSTLPEMDRYITFVSTWLSSTLICAALGWYAPAHPSPS